MLSSRRCCKSKQQILARPLFSRARDVYNTRLHRSAVFTTGGAAVEAQIGEALRDITARAYDGIWFLLLVFTTGGAAVEAQVGEALRDIAVRAGHKVDFGWLKVSTYADVC